MNPHVVVIGAFYVGIGAFIALDYMWWVREEEPGDDTGMEIAIGALLAVVFWLPAMIVAMVRLTLHGTERGNL